MPDLDGDASPRGLRDLRGLGFSLWKVNWVNWVVRLRASGQSLGKVVRFSQAGPGFLIGLASGPEAHPHGLRTASYLLL